MNAITYWISQRFSFSWWTANLDAECGGISLGVMDFDWIRADEAHYYCLTFGLLGLCGSLIFWPNGKYDETDGAGA